MRLPPPTELHPDLGALVATMNIGDEYFWEPDRLMPFVHWVGHIPFAFWIVKALRPRTIVELGTHRGNSYCALCQAVSALQLETRATAVDTWEGDIHMMREVGVYDELRKYHDARYGHFSNLLRMTFDEGRDHFQDGTVDLLHIDGTHTYEAARHDFEFWLSALSSRAVVLFHDITVRRDDFGVWKLWEELVRQYPSFNFEHSYGLGILGVGPIQDPAMVKLYALARDSIASARFRSLFSARGEAFVGRLRLTETAASLDRMAAAEREQTRQLMKERLQGQHSAQTRQLSAEREETGLRIAELKAAHACELDAERQNARRWMKELQAIHARERTTERREAQHREALLQDRLLVERGAVRAATEANQQAHGMAEMWQERSSVLQSRLDAVETSMTWRIMRPVRQVSSILPARMRRLVRHGLGRCSAISRRWAMRGGGRVSRS